MENIILPTKLEVLPGATANEATIVVEPCYYGYGTTLGNSLRRVLLSSLPGAAVTAVKIKNASHEFTVIEGVKEDVLEIILNFKELRLRMHTNEEVCLILKAHGEKIVKAKDIVSNSAVEIVNPDLKIATLTSPKAELEMEIFVNKGRGYVPTEERDTKNLAAEVIAVDAIYTPIKDVGYKVESVRVGKITNYDRLLLHVVTDGSISPKDAFCAATEILIDHYNLLLQFFAPKPKVPEVKVEEKKEEVKIEEQPVAPAEVAPALSEEAAPAKRKRGRPRKTV